ncbi:MAG: VCBS repeat-containing protein [Planctomycetes bacterium]|nr:VCBS repeat-containing protein [Planctomycetota bacterium]
MFPFAPKAAGDVDGDGIDDFTGRIAGTLFVHSGATGAAIPYLTRVVAGAAYTATGDVDADGFDDLVLNLGLASVALVSGATGQTLRQWTTPAIGVNFTGAAPGADFDGDGCSDVVLIANTVVEVYSGRTGSLLYNAPYWTGFGDPSEVMVGDWNGDGLSDLAITTSILGSMSIATGPAFAMTISGGGVFGSNPTRPLGDIAGNGTSAIASLVQSPGQTTLLDGIGGPVIGVLPAATVRHFGDADGDGCDDFMFQASTPNPTLDGLTSGRTLVKLPSTISAFNIATPGVGDIDGDGRQDGWTNLGGQAAIAHWVDPTTPLASRIVRRGASGSTATGRRPRLHARGHGNLGSTLRLDVRGLLPNGLSVLTFGGFANVDLAPLGAPGNRLYTTVDGSAVLPTNATGLGHQALAIPANPALLGATVSLQAAAWDPAANALGLVASNALDLTVAN